MTSAALFEQFAVKYGQGANLILNVPPNASGVVPAEYLLHARIVLLTWGFRHTEGLPASSLIVLNQMLLILGHIC